MLSGGQASILESNQMYDMITVGKFMPFHLGHEFMIKFASNVNKSGKILILLDGTEFDTIPVSVRKGLITQQLFNNGIDAIIEIVHPDVVSDSYDEYGTSTDENFWKVWIDLFREKIEKYKLKKVKFFSSDMYGQEVSKRLGCEWLPVDSKRDIFPISGSMIRKNLNKHFHLMTSEFQKYMRFNNVCNPLKIVISGPESTGKTTLTKFLAQKYNTVMIPEYGRTISEVNKNILTHTDFVNIAIGREAMYKTLVNKNFDKGYVFLDTDFYTTYLFSGIYLDKYMDLGEFFHRADFIQKADLYILLKPTEFFEDDGERVIPNYEDRVEFYNNLKKCYDIGNCNYVEIEPLRPLDEMFEEIDKLLEGVCVSC